MPPLALLNQKDALMLAREAAADFPGLLVLLRPALVPRPLTEEITILGFTLVIAGQRGNAPWFTCASVAEYDQLYERVYAYYDEDAEPEDLDEDDGEDETYPPALSPLPAVGLVSSPRRAPNGSA
jgi:hypothetical protein